METAEKRRFPGVGLRNIKTACSATLCALLYFLLLPDRNPAFACIGAIFGMGANMEHSKLHGGNRLFWVGAVQPGGVVLCLLLFSIGPDNYISYSLNRMFDTGVGVVMSLLINYLLPRERLEGWIEWGRDRWNAISGRGEN